MNRTNPGDAFSMTAPVSTKPELGAGIYTIPDAASILDMPVDKVRLWVNKYWELEFLKTLQNTEAYTWGEKREKALNFYTLIEIIAVASFRKIGVSFPKIKDAHEHLITLLDTPYPFAHAKLMSDGKRIFYEVDASLLELDQAQQLSFTQLVAPYCKKIDFQDKTQLAERYWPLGKDNNIVVDPRHSFGQPVISGTNTTIDAIANMLMAGESSEMVASLYELEPKDVESVRLYIKRSAA